ASLSGSVAIRSAGVVTVTGLVGLAGGAGLGFLFGIPRSVQPSQPATGDGTVQSRPNTNLEDLSDWLTKIIIGLGLAQLYHLTVLLDGFRTLVATYCPPEDKVTPLVAMLTLVFGLVTGFLWLYLQTRTIVSRIFLTFDSELVGKLKTALTAITNKLPGGGVELRHVADTLKSAANLDPSDPVLRATATKALAAAGRTQEAAAIIPSTANPSMDDQISRVLVALYQAGGFTAAIALLQQLASDPSATARYDYWLYRACAYGQLYQSFAPVPPSALALDARNEVLQATRGVIAIDSFERERLKRLAHPERYDKTEDDLSAFGADPDFVALVGE